MSYVHYVTDLPDYRLPGVMLHCSRWTDLHARLSRNGKCPIIVYIKTHFLCLHTMIQTPYFFISYFFLKSMSDSDGAH